MSEEPNPFQSPQTISELPIRVGGILRQRAARFASGRALAIWAAAMLVCVIAGDLAGVASEYLEIQLIERAVRGEEITYDEWDSSYFRQVGVVLLQYSLLLASAWAFMAWFHRAHRNLPSLNSGRLDYSPGWAVGGFLIPILNLFRPYQMMREVWRGSDPRFIQDASVDSRYAPVPAMVVVWWSLWILRGIVKQLAIPPLLDRFHPEVMLAPTWLCLAANLVSAVAAIPAIALVLAVDRNQQIRHELVAAMEPKVVVAPDALAFEPASQDQ